MKSDSPCAPAPRVLTPSLRVACAGLLALVAVALSGCSPYSLKGKVIAGDISYIAIVEADDPRLADPGLAGARLRLETDPGRISRDVVGEAVSGAGGAFTMPFSKAGARVLMYDVGMTVRREGYSPATIQFKLPPSNKRMLVILTPGPDRMGDPDADDPLRQFERHR